MSINFKKGVELLKNKESAIIGDVRLELISNTELHVSGASETMYFTNLRKSNCFRELEEIKEIFFHILETSTDFRAFVEGKEIQFELTFSDAGKASILVCYEKYGVVTWNLGTMG